MKIKLSLLISFVFLCCTACSNAQSSSSAAEKSSEASSAVQTTASHTDSSSQQTTSESKTDSKEDSETKLLISVADTQLTATLADNSSAKALVELLKQGDITVDMSDYSNFEKVGELPEELPRNDEQLDTDYGDLILYLGHRFVIYYDKNSWEFTKLGHIDNITQEELKDILGDGDVTVTLSVK